MELNLPKHKVEILFDSGTHTIEWRDGSLCALDHQTSSPDDRDAVCDCLEIVQAWPWPKDADRIFSIVAQDEPTPIALSSSATPAYLASARRSTRELGMNEQDSQIVINEVRKLTADSLMGSVLPELGECLISDLLQTRKDNADITRWASPLSRIIRQRLATRWSIRHISIISPWLANPSVAIAARTREILHLSISPRWFVEVWMQGFSEINGGLVIDVMRDGTSQMRALIANVKTKSVTWEPIETG